jgi:hypothetical protein
MANLGIGTECKMWAMLGEACSPDGGRERSLVEAGSANNVDFAEAPEEFLLEPHMGLRSG